MKQHYLLRAPLVIGVCERCWVQIGKTFKSDQKRSCTLQALQAWT